MRENGDFTSQDDAKTENSALAEYWAYMNGWIAIAAQKIGDFDVAYPAYHYLLSFSHPTLGGFTTNKPYGQGDSAVDVLTAAHLGLMALYFGNLEKAKASGLLDRFIAAQPDLGSAFYLRMNERGELVTDLTQEAALLFAVSPTQPNQAYFMIGYPVAFLGQIYRATGDRFYLNSAIKYLDFALSCHDSIRSFHFSHKVAWGAAIIANLTGDMKYAAFSKSIADYLLSIQHGEGFWLKDEPEHTLFDQTAEIAIWLKEISKKLRTV